MILYTRKMIWHAMSNTNSDKKDDERINQWERSTIR
jgi:hypothetical protein